MRLNLDEGVQMTFLKCGFSVHPGTQEHDFTCPACRIELSSLYTNPKGFCRECHLMNKASLHNQEYQLPFEGYGLYTFDVSKINAILDSASRPSRFSRLIRMPDWLLFKMLQVNVTEPIHYDHITGSQKPGIFAEILFPDGKPGGALIDGSHRAARAVKDSRPYFVYQLAWPLTQDILIR